MAALLKADNGDGDAGIIAEINITPLTDVFLVLLIIFMVTSSVIANTGKQVALPEAQHASETPPKAVTVTLSKDGALEVGGAPVARAALREYLARALEGREEKLVVLKGDREIPYGEAIFVLDQAQDAGATGFALQTKRVKRRR